MLHAFSPKTYDFPRYRFFLYRLNGTLVRGFPTIDEMQEYMISIEADIDDYILSTKELTPGQVAETAGKQFNETVMRMSCIIMLLGRKGRTQTEASMKKRDCLPIYFEYCGQDRDSLKTEYRNLEKKLSKNFKDS